MYISNVKKLNTVTFPEYTGERVYMEKFYKEQGLPKSLSRWQPTVDQMLENIDTDKPIFIMIDQSVVQPNTSQRRPGPHIDGYWVEELQDHSGSSGGHKFHLGSWDVNTSPWQHVNFDTPESIILASDVSACRGFLGTWEGSVGEGGDLSHINLHELETIQLEANISYLGNVSFIHESLPLTQKTERTLVRLNLQGY